MKTLLTFLLFLKSIIALSQLDGNYYLKGYSVNGEFIPIPVNDELPFAVTEFGSNWDGEDYFYKMTTICGMRRFEVEYTDNQLKIIELAGIDNASCTQSENQTFQTAYFNLFPNDAVFDIAYIDFEGGGGGIELSRATETGEFVMVYYSTELNTNDQYNPVQNLQWEHWYESPNNYFALSWDMPAQPHAELVGYNVYRENELYRFQTGTSLYNLPEGSNVEVDFLFYPEENPMPFNVHVTAVYEGGFESNYTETVFVEGPALSTTEVANPSVSFYPNPTKDFLHFSEFLKEIKVYDLSGKLIKTQPNSTEKLDVNDLPKGTYILSGTTDSGGKIHLKFVKK